MPYLDGRFFNKRKLWELSTAMPEQQFEVDQLMQMMQNQGQNRPWMNVQQCVIDRPWKNAEEQKKILGHLARVFIADTGQPGILILYPSRYGLVEGQHRLAKAYFLGEKYFKVRIFANFPEEAFTRQQEEKKTQTG